MKPIVEKFKDCTGYRLFHFYRKYATKKAINKAINYELKEIRAALNMNDLE